MKKILAIFLSITILSSTSTTIYAKETDETRTQKVEILIEQMLKEDGPENGSLWNKENTTSFKWSYINGCMVSAILDLYKVKGDKKYKNFADNYMSPFISTTKDSTKGYIAADKFKISSYTLDDLNNGKALIELVNLNSANKNKYQKALTETLYTDILQYELNNQKTAEGNLWHKKAYPYQVWLDGIYMETPFWLEYELNIINSQSSFINASNNITNQIENVYSKLRDTSTGLYYHGYDAQADKNSGNYNSSNAISWATKNTGHSSSYWLRGTGWYAMALVDDIELMQNAQKKYNIDLSSNINKLSNIYTELIDSLLKYQDNNTKMWYQVIDKKDSKYNYIETSGSAAISYSLMKSYNIGITNIDYYNKGLEVFRGICDNKLVYSSETKVELNDICMTAGLAGPNSGVKSSSATIGPKHNARDSSYDYYVSEKIVSNDAKGIAPLIFAYCQMLNFNKNIGDVNLDNIIDTKDTALILKYISGSVKLTKEQLNASDINKDGKVDINDTVSLLKLL